MTPEQIKDFDALRCALSDWLVSQNPAIPIAEAVLVDAAAKSIAMRACCFAHLAEHVSTMHRNALAVALEVFVKHNPNAYEGESHQG